MSVSNQILRQIFTNETVVINKCDGKRTIGNLPHEYAIRKFRTDWEMLAVTWGNLLERDVATEETPVSVYEMIQKTGEENNCVRYDKMFGSLNRDLNTLCLTQHQILEFCKENKWRLCDHGKNNYFLVKGTEQFFVVKVRSVYSDSILNTYNDLNIEICRIDEGSSEPLCRERLVVPQQKK